MCGPQDSPGNGVGIGDKNWTDWSLFANADYAYGNKQHGLLNVLPV